MAKFKVGDRIDYDCDRWTVLRVIGRPAYANRGPYYRLRGDKSGFEMERMCRLVDARSAFVGRIPANPAEEIVESLDDLARDLESANSRPIPFQPTAEETTDWVAVRLAIYRGMRRPSLKHAQAVEAWIRGIPPLHSVNIPPAWTSPAPYLSADVTKQVQEIVGAGREAWNSQNRVDLVVSNDPYPNRKIGNPHDHGPGLYRVNWKGSESTIGYVEVVKIHGPDAFLISTGLVIGTGSYSAWEWIGPPVGDPSTKAEAANG